MDDNKQLVYLRHRLKHIDENIKYFHKAIAEALDKRNEILKLIQCIQLRNFKLNIEDKE